MTPPDRVSEPVSLSGRPDRHQLEGVAERHAVDLGLAGAHRVTTTPVTTRTPPVAIASAPALRSSLMSSSTPLPSMGPRIEIVTPGPADGIESGVGADAFQVGGDLIDRDVAA